MYLHISSSLSLSNHPWISQNENCILVNSSLPLIRAFWDPLISPFWSPQHIYGFPSKHLTSLVTEYVLVLWGVSLPQGGSIYHYSILTGGSLYHGGQNTISHRQVAARKEVAEPDHPDISTATHPKKRYDCDFLRCGDLNCRVGTAADF